MIVSGLCLLSVLPVFAEDLEWIGGTANWNSETSASNWNPAQVPTSSDNVFFNGSSDYTATVDDAGTSLQVTNITVGTSSSVGTTQTLAVNIPISSTRTFTFTTMTIGANGVVQRSGKFFDPTPAQSAASMLTIQSGGRFETTAIGGAGNDLMRLLTNMTVDNGGTYFIAGTGAGLANADVWGQNNSGGDNHYVFTVNGQVTGERDILIIGNHLLNKLTGSGVVDGGGDLYFGHNLTLGGTITINRDIFNSAASGTQSGLFVENTGNVTLNGNITIERVSNQPAMFSLGPGSSASDSSTVGGSGIIQITANSTGTQSVNVGGIGSALAGTTGGTLTFTGSGSLAFDMSAANTKNIQFRSNTLNLSRDSNFSAAVGNTGFYAFDGVVNNSGSGVEMTVNSGAALRFANINQRLNVDGAASLVMNGGTIEGNSDGTADNLTIGNSSAGSFILNDGTTSTLRRSAASAVNDLYVNLAANAEVVVGNTAVLRMEHARLRVDMAEADDWGFSDNGQILIAGTGNYLQALSMDLGNAVNIDEIPFSIETLAFSGLLETITFNLWDPGSSGRTALYVKTLDLSNLTLASVALDGLSGAAVVYYESIAGGDSFQLSGNFQQIVAIPEASTLGLLGLGALALAARIRTRRS